MQAYDQYNILGLIAMPMHHTVQFSVTLKIVHSCMKLGISRCVHVGVRAILSTCKLILKCALPL